MNEIKGKSAQTGLEIAVIGMANAGPLMKRPPEVNEVTRLFNEIFENINEA